jgi:hypothetical protein
MSLYSPNPAFALFRLHRFPRKLSPGSRHLFIAKPANLGTFDDVGANWRNLFKIYALDADPMPVCQV